MQQLSEAGLAQLVGSIYEAGVDFSRWKSTLDRLAQAFDAPSAALTGGNVDGSELWAVTTGIEDEFIARYQQYYHTVNPIWSRTMTSPVGAVQTDSMVMPKADFQRSEFFNDFLRPQGVMAMLGATVQAEAGRQTVLSLHGVAEFEPAHQAIYVLLAPHLQRAIEINDAFATREFQTSAASLALERLDRGLLAVDHSARILYANARVGQLLERGLLRSERGVLLGHRKHDTERLHYLIKKCAGQRQTLDQGATITLPRQRGEAGVVALIAPLKPEVSWFAVERPAAMVIVSEPKIARSMPEPWLMERYGLTPAEARIAGEVMKGDGVGAVAKRLGVSSATARTHLMRIFAKTGTHRQAELVRLLIGEVGE